MKKLYLIPLLCLFTFSLTFSKCSCGNPSCGGCSTSASQPAGEDWRCCCKGCDCTKMGHNCDNCGCGIPEDAFVKAEESADEPVLACSCDTCEQEKPAIQDEQEKEVQS